MWLAYMRFDSTDDTRVALVRCGSKPEYEAVLAAAKGYRAWELTEYAVFQSRNTIHARVVPNFPEELIYDAADFIRACGVEPGSTTPPGSAARSPGASTRALPGVRRLPPNGS